MAPPVAHHHYVMVVAAHHHAVMVAVHHHVVMVAHRLGLSGPGQRQHGEGRRGDHEFHLVSFLRAMGAAAPVLTARRCLLLARRCCGLVSRTAVLRAETIVSGDRRRG
jgi:hypothetical protein